MLVKYKLGNEVAKDRLYYNPSYVIYRSHLNRLPSRYCFYLEIDLTFGVLLNSMVHWIFYETIGP